MELLGEVLLTAGAAGLFVGYCWALVLAFQRGTGFGVACLLVSVVLLFFLTTSFLTTWRVMLLLALSSGLLLAGVKLQG